jgi:predicted DCC family thiol-disulfide oxidoreductase YuxK
MPSDSPNPIILYDGICGFCDRIVQFILKRDIHDRFRFAALQSEFSRPLLKIHGVNTQILESICLVLDYGLPTEHLLVRSDVVISIVRELGTFWRMWANLLAILPRSLRDWGYDLVARYRYRIFGKFDTCPLPQAGDRHKFLDLV